MPRDSAAAATTAAISFAMFRNLSLEMVIVTMITNKCTNEGTTSTSVFACSMGVVVFVNTKKEVNWNGERKR